ncbi:MAG: outer membrane beta-barrel domain-containing protein [Bacteriovoracia bacterium]
MSKRVLAFIFLLLFASAFNAYAETEDEYNFSWVDPDKKIYVIQNRKFTKAGHVGLFVSGALNLSNPFKMAYAGIPRAAYWISEAIGIEVFYAKEVNFDNDTLKSLRTVNSTALPFVREHRSYYGALLSWSPWYGKVNFFNLIVYYDWFINAGGGQLQTALDINRSAYSPSNFQEETIPAVFFGTGYQFYLNNNFLLRLDLMGMGYSAKGADNTTERIYTNWNFAAGLGLKL